MGVKEYELPNGRKAVFEFDENGVGKITIEAMDSLMGMLKVTDEVVKRLKAIPTAKPKEYVKDGSLTIQARTIKEVNSIDRVVVCADGCQREYLMPLPEGQKEGEWEICIHPKDPPFSWWRCSECGMIIYSESETDRYEFHAYCGRCGAEMKGR